MREAQSADLIFASDYGLPAALARFLFRKPLVLKNVSDFAWEFSTRHGWLPPDQTIDEFQCRRQDLRVRMLQWLRAWYARVANVVIVPSEYVATLVAGWGVSAERTRVIHNALDERHFASLPDKVTARMQCGLPAASPLLLTVARLVSWKGIAGIIRVLPRVQLRFPDVKLLIAGDGPDRVDLQSIAGRHNDAVQFLGMQSQHHVHHLMCAADVFVLFSTYEGLPHTVLEAMACGIPVVASAVGGTVEVVRDERTGILVSPRDEEALVAAICRILCEPAFGDSLAERAHDDLGRFSWARLLDDTEAIFLEAA
jgi:glycosyltransferase involved in cell wall biosynthesis